MRSSAAVRQLRKAGYDCESHSKHIFIIQDGKRILQLGLGKLSPASEKMVNKLLSGRGLSMHETRALKAE